jgi:hypothetical protein
MCKRFFKDLDNTADYYFDPIDLVFVIEVIQGMFVHKEGQDLQGNSLAGIPFLLQP